MEVPDYSPWIQGIVHSGRLEGKSHGYMGSRKQGLHQQQVFALPSQDSYRKCINNAIILPLLQMDISKTLLSQWNVLFYGQCIALYLACCSAASSTLQSMTGIQNMPLFQIAGGYFFLSFFILKLIKRENASHIRTNGGGGGVDMYADDMYADDIESEASTLLKAEHYQQHDGFQQRQHPHHTTTTRTYKLPLFNNILIYSPW
jgi:hypothetical protein